MSNFAFLQAEWGFLQEAAHRAEQAVYNAPRTACFYARRGLELGVGYTTAPDVATCAAPRPHPRKVLGQGHRPLDELEHMHQSKNHRRVERRFTVSLPRCQR